MSEAKIVPSITIGVYKKYMHPYLNILSEYSRKDTTTAGIRNDLKVFQSYLERSKKRRIHMDTLHDYVTYLKRDRENCDGTINRKLCSCKNYFNYIAGKPDVGAGVLPLDSMIKLKLNDSSPTKALTVDEVRSIIEAIDGTTIIGIRDRMLYGLIYNLGLRISEVVGINIKDIDYKNKKLTITGKGGKTRALSLGKEALKSLKRYLVCRAEFMNSHTEDALFISKKGKRIAVRTVQYNFSIYRKRAGELSLERVTPHSLRHAFASHWIDSGSDKITLKAMLGHAKMETTDQYVHPSLEAQRKALESHPGNKMLEDYIKSNNLSKKFYYFKKHKNENICPHCQALLCLTAKEKKYA